MKRFLILLLILGGCSSGVTNIETEKEKLIKTDQDFSQMCSDKGMKEAFTFYSAEEVIKMREGEQPLFGKKELIQDLESIPDGSMHLIWAPVKADVSGDLGYTFGKWELRISGMDTIQYGTYVTVWKKQPDGTWKFVLDAGNSAPRP